MNWSQTHLLNKREISNLRYDVMVDACIKSNEVGCADILRTIYDSGMTQENYLGGRISLAQISEQTPLTSLSISETGTAVVVLCAAGLAFYTATFLGKGKK